MDIIGVAYLWLAGIFAGAGLTLWALIRISAGHWDEPEDRLGCLSAVVVAIPILLSVVFLGLTVSRVLFES